MPNYIDPAVLNDVPLILKRIGNDDYSVRFLDRIAGRIMLQPMLGGRTMWLWTLTGPYIPPELQPSHGNCGSMEEATAFRDKFDRWQGWAQTLGRAAAWNG